jgi:type II secretory pathway pseudopilin PulG
MIAWGRKNPGEFLNSAHSERAAIAIHSVVDELPGQSGIALLVALIIMTSLSLLALSLALLTDSLIRLNKNAQNRAQAHYAALAGLEEGRGRLRPSAPDAISPTLLPQNVKDVLYIVNSSTQDPVNPTSPSSPYFDYEYAQEFSSGFSGANLRGTVASDQPGAGTAYSIPYKWVRITLKTEYAAKQDVNQDGVLDSTTPVYWDGSHQDLATNMPTGVRVYRLTALAVGPSGVRKLTQTEVEGTGGASGLSPNVSASLATASSVSLTGASTPNLIISGMDGCLVQNLPGVSAGGSITTKDKVTILGMPTPSLQNAPAPSPSAANLIQSWQAFAKPILTADPTHVSYNGTSYVGSNVVLGQQGPPPQPLIVYSDKPLSIGGTNAGGVGLLLVNGNLNVTAGFTYRGLIVVNGNVTLDNDVGNISLGGAIIASGIVQVTSDSQNKNTITLQYNSCAISEATTGSAGPSVL